MEKIIANLGLSEHPEGGFFRQTFKSHVMVQPQDQPTLKAAVSHIYYFLPKGTYSRFHKNRYDEIWNLYSGEGVKLYLFNAPNRLVEENYLSFSEYRFHAVIPGGIWQAAEPIGDFALVGCSVAPGWEIQDEVYLADEHIDSKTLVELRPELVRLVSPAS